MAQSGTDVALAREQEEVIRAARRLRHAVVFLVWPDGSGGTGFVISRAHRLVVTVGHLADGFFEEGSISAFLEGSSKRLSVDKVWYHPRLRRELDFGLVANSLDPTDGPISDLSPDLALIQLSPEAGDLQQQCEVQVGDGPRILDGHTVGLLGFWDANERHLPDDGHPAAASLSTSIIHRASDGAERSERAPAPFIFLDARHTHLGGTSGAPIFLADGLVVGLVTTSRFERTEPGKRNEMAGLRLGCLRELITYHGLQELMPGLTKAAARRDWGPDPNIQRLRRAISLVRKVREDRDAGRYAAAVDMCNSALAIAPDYGRALLERSKAYFCFLDSRWVRLSADERRRFSSWALSDSERCNALDPNSNHVRLIHIQNIIVDSFACSEPADLRYVVQRTTYILSSNWKGKPLTIREEARAFNLRAQAYHLLGETRSAEADFAKSIRVDPWERNWYLTRAKFWDQTGRPDLARADRMKSADATHWEGEP